jgi:hypothetical protein
VADLAIKAGQVGHSTGQLQVVHGCFECGSLPALGQPFLSFLSLLCRFSKAGTGRALDILFWLLLQFLWLKILPFTISPSLPGCLNLLVT